MQPTPERPDPERPPQRLPALRRTIVRPPDADATDGVFFASRLTTLAHELSSLIDGSMRVVGLARRSLDPAHPACPEQVVRQLDTVSAAMMQMADLVRQSMIGLSDLGPDGLRAGFGACSSVADAVRHAVDVMAPLADDAGVAIDCDIAHELNGVVAGPIYSVVTNGVKNAIESIRAASERAAGPGVRGHIHVRAWLQPAKHASATATVHIQVLDDGLGPPRTPPGSPETPFTPGFSTKPGSSGIGLSLSRDIVHQLQGTIDLSARPRDPKTGRCGAALSVAYPAPGNTQQRALAG
jgi:signal transduction histidine kinase